MSAGYGIRHNGMNTSSVRSVHFLQLWIQPSQISIKPSYAQARFDDAAITAGWLCLAAPTSVAPTGTVTLPGDGKPACRAAGVRREYVLRTPRTWLPVVPSGRAAIQHWIPCQIGGTGPAAH